MRKNAPQYVSLHAGRGLAALLIVIHHAAHAISYGSGLWRDERVFRWFQGLALSVEFFFVLSGIVIYLAHRKDFGNASAVRNYLWKRFRRVYPIYWFVTAAWLLLYNFLARVPDNRAHDPWMIISSFLLVHMGNLYTALTVGWTLFHEVLFYAIFVAMLIFRRVGYLIVATWMISGLLAPLVFSSPWLTEYIFSPLHILFGYGMAVAWLADKTPFRFSLAIFLVGASSLLACIIAAAWYGFLSVWVQQLAGASGAFMCLGMMSYEGARRITPPKWLIVLGDASYSIYLVHMLVNAVIQKRVYRLDVSLHIGYASCMILLVIAGLGVGLACHFLVEKPLLDLITNRRTGRVPAI